MRMLLALTAALLVGACAPKAPTTFDVRFGILGEDNGSRVLKRETTSIPFITREKGQAFGAVISPSDESSYRFHTVIYLPASPAKLTGDIGRVPPAQATEGIRSAPKTTRGKTFVEMWFDEGDPVGRYKVEIYVNDALLRAIEFDTVAP